MITAQGANEVAQFESIEQCLEAKAQITKHDSFCYQRKPVDIEQTMNHMTNMLARMKQGLDNIKEEK